jgi:hypothetical protein
MNTATPQKTIKLTRSIRRQIYTADLVFALVTNISGSVPKNVKSVLIRIQKRIDNINGILYGNQRFVLSPRDHKKYNQVINKIKKLIIDVDDGDMLSPDFFNAIMLLVEDTYESVKASKKKTLQHEWRMLRNSMGTFCNHVINEPDEFDPDWPGYKYEALGVALGKKFEAVMMS